MEMFKERKREEEKEIPQLANPTTAHMIVTFQQMGRNGSATSEINTRTSKKAEDRLEVAQNLDNLIAVNEVPDAKSLSRVVALRLGNILDGIHNTNEVPRKIAPV